MVRLLSSVAVLTLSAALAAAQADTTDVPGHLERLSNVQSTGPASTLVEQSGDHAEAIRKTLAQIKLPPGFKIGLYAVVPDARHMAVGPQGIVTFVGTRKDKVWAVSDRNRDGVADEVRDFAPSLTFAIPNGPCFGKDGSLYLAEQNRVLLFPKAEAVPESGEVAAFQLVKQGELIPPREESFGHSARVCKIGPDGRIYISLGQPFNVAPPEKLDLYDEWGIGGIIRLNLDGTGREVYTRGIRNSVGHDFHPVTGALWFTDNQVDGMGDDIPPGEINRQTAPGQHFGAPWFGGGSVRTKEYRNSEPPAETVLPAVEMEAHAADLGMTFYTGTVFPEKYHNAIFSAQHGSWNRTTPVGARVMVTYVAEDGSATSEPFAEGWIDANGDYLGRPADVAQLSDGSILVSDDLAGALYRIWYEGG